MAQPVSRRAVLGGGAVLGAGLLTGLRADFRGLDAVSQPGAAVGTRASFVVPAGTPGLQQA